MEWQSYLDTNRPDLFEWAQVWGPEMRHGVYFGYRRDSGKWVVMNLGKSGTTIAHGFIVEDQDITHWAPLITVAPEPSDYRMVIAECCATCDYAGYDAGYRCTKYGDKKVKPNYMCMEWEG